MSKIAEERILIDGEVQNAKNELTKVENARSVLEKRIAQEDGQLTESRKHIRELEAVIDKQKTDHEKAAATNALQKADIEKQKTAHSEEMKTLRQQLETQAIEFANVKEKTNRANELLKSSLATEKNEHSADLARLTDRDILIRQGNDANKLLESSLEAEQKEHRADLARLTDEIGDLQEENRFFQNDATESKQEIKRLLLVIDDRDSSIRQRNEDLLASQASNAGFQETINELQTTLDNKQRFMDQLMQQIRNESDN